MASIILEYEYDIFISYRQKDNKGDRWVSKFVETLRTELESTFKEDVSIYFDENPHDRLQETHDVDKSLEVKLKCLIFIPILSQTYCDPNSYAWKYEFLAFNKLAKEDQLGKSIKLRNGNYASRILPIRIHDLEQEDIKLFEKETGSVLRAMDFVFKTSSGVNRPLQPEDERLTDNLNKIIYRDQINKVANAIKEIIHGIKAESIPVEKERTIIKEPIESLRKEDDTVNQKRPIKQSRIKLLSGVLILTILLIAAIIVLPKLFRQNTLNKLRSSDGRISVAVMPFQNLTNDTIWNIWQDGIQSNLITSLSSSEELKVRQLEPVSGLLQAKGITNYASITPSIASSISQKLAANVFIYGSINQAGSTIRLNAQIIDSETEDSFKSFRFEGAEGSILQMIDSLSVAIRNALIISYLGKNIEQDVQLKIGSTTSSPEAFRFFIYGEKAFFKRDYATARYWYEQSINIDSNYFGAILKYGTTYLNQNMFDQAKKVFSKLYEKRETMSGYQKVMAMSIYSYFFETPNEVIKYLKQLLELDDQSAGLLYSLGLEYNRLFQYEKAIPEFEKALELYNKWESKPLWIYNYTILGLAYHKTGQYDKERELYKKAEQDFPDDPALIYRQAVLSFAEGDTILAQGYIKKYNSVLQYNSVSEANLASSVGSIYEQAGILDSAEKYIRKAASLNPALQPVNPDFPGNLAWFLINTGKNINEGLELVEKELKLYPENSYSLATKGWGLYKQGKLEESLKYLEKARELRPIYNHLLYQSIQEVKDAIAKQNQKL